MRDLGSFRSSLLVGIAAVLIVGGCARDAGEGVATLTGSSTQTTGEPTRTLDPEDALLEYTQCLRDQGLDVADPEVDASGNLRPPRPAGAAEGTIDREAVQAARVACGGLLDGVAFGLGAADETVLQDTILAYTACMRENGVDMPDPDFSGTGGPGGGRFGLGDVDRTSADFQAANDTCLQIFTDAGLEGVPGPGGAPGGPRGSGAGG